MGSYLLTNNSGHRKRSLSSKLQNIKCVGPIKKIMRVVFKKWAKQENTSNLGGRDDFLSPNLASIMMACFISLHPLKSCSKFP